MKVRPTDADYRDASARLGYSWRRTKALALQVAVERMLQENQREQMRLIALSESQKGNLTEYLATQDRLTAVFDVHGKLMDIAYPRTAVARKDTGEIEP